MIGFEETLDVPGNYPQAQFDLDDRFLVAAAWSKLVEPGDTIAGALVNAVGQAAALRWVFAAVGSPDHKRRAIAGLCERTRATQVFARRLGRALDRWAPRLESLEPERDIAHLRGMSGVLLVPGTTQWPTRLADLGDAQPHCLWVRGGPDLAAGPEADASVGENDWLGQSLDRSVALVGARACTDYGTSVTHELSTGLADRKFSVVSGGAYGIDAAAHRGALASGGTTFALLAGGVDRLYPAGNAKLLAAVIESGGAAVSEVPPGAVPSRSRFLQRKVQLHVSINR